MIPGRRIVHAADEERVITLETKFAAIKWLLSGFENSGIFSSLGCPKLAFFGTRCLYMTSEKQCSDQQNVSSLEWSSGHVMCFLVARSATGSRMTRYCAQLQHRNSRPIMALYLLILLQRTDLATLSRSVSR